MTRIVATVVLATVFFFVLAGQGGAQLFPTGPDGRPIFIQFYICPDQSIVKRDYRESAVQNRLHEEFFVNRFSLDALDSQRLAQQITENKVIFGNAENPQDPCYGRRGQGPDHPAPRAPMYIQATPSGPTVFEAGGRYYPPGLKMMMGTPSGPQGQPPGLPLPGQYTPAPGPLRLPTYPPPPSPLPGLQGPGMGLQQPGQSPTPPTTPTPQTVRVWSGRGSWTDWVFADVTAARRKGLIIGPGGRPDYMSPDGSNGRATLAGLLAVGAIVAGGMVALDVVALSSAYTATLPAGAPAGSYWVQIGNSIWQLVGPAAPTAPLLLSPALPR